MLNKDNSGCKIMGSESSEDCPEEYESGKTCWETSFLQDNWQKVFERCRHCKVFQQSLTKQK